MNLLQSFDWVILNWIHNNLQCGFLDFLMPKITVLGDMGAVWIVAAIVLLFTKKYRKQGVLLLGSLVLCVLIGNLCLKPLIARARPCWLKNGILLLISNPTDFSFPSGHTLASVAGATGLFLTNRKFGWFAIPLATVIAFSRLYLYVHFPTDVFASICFGILIAVFTFTVGGKVFDFTGKKTGGLIHEKKK